MTPCANMTWNHNFYYTHNRNTDTSKFLLNWTPIQSIPEHSTVEGLVTWRLSSSLLGILSLLSVQILDNETLIIASSNYHYHWTNSAPRIYSLILDTCYARIEVSIMKFILGSQINTRKKTWYRYQQLYFLCLYF